MPVVNVRHVTEAAVDVVWNTLLDCERFPSYMHEVREVEILRDDGERRHSRWLVLLKGSELEWEEDEVVDHRNHRIDFRQTEGDLAYFDGWWQVGVERGRTVIELVVEFDIGIPMMAEMLNPVAARALEDNSKAILDQLSRQAGRPGAESSP